MSSPPWALPAWWANTMRFGAEMSAAFGEGLRRAIAGSASHFVIRSRDAYGNVRSGGGDDWCVWLRALDEADEVWISARARPWRSRERHSRADSRRTILR